MVTLTENCPSLEVVYTPLYVSCCSFVAVPFGQSTALPSTLFSLRVPPRTDFPLTTMLAACLSLGTLPRARGCAGDGTFRACALVDKAMPTSTTSTTNSNFEHQRPDSTEAGVTQGRKIGGRVQRSDDGDEDEGQGGVWVSRRSEGDVVVDTSTKWHVPNERGGASAGRNARVTCFGRGRAGR